MPDKVFKTYNEMIELLRSRGVSINTTEDENYAKNVLSKEGYYNLINGYSKLFWADHTQTQYKSGTTICEINALYHFDRILRDTFFRHILRVETHVKNLIAHAFSQRYGHSNYLLYTNFNPSVQKAQEKIPSLIAEIQRQIAGRTSDPSISHYLRKYGYIPLWVLNNILTFGTISKFYSLMKVQERQEVSREFRILDTELENLLLYLSSVRNFCAHGNRLYCYRTKKPLIDTPLHVSLNIPQNASGEYQMGKRDLFAAAIALRRLLSHNDYRRMSNEIYHALFNLCKKLIVLKQDEVLREMGFPQNWKNLNPRKNSR